MKRIFGLDLVRSIAVIMVLSVHFFLNNGFYDLKINGFFAYLSIFLRWLFYIGVPLFIIITGYLKNNKKLNKEYYKGIRKVVISYFFISLICIIFKKYFLHDSTRLLRLFLGIFNFTTLEYSWYIEMYIGLFLLIPFFMILLIIVFPFFRSLNLQIVENIEKSIENKLGNDTYNPILKYLYLIILCPFFLRYRLQANIQIKNILRYALLIAFIYPLILPVHFMQSINGKLVYTFFVFVVIDGKANYEHWALQFTFIYYGTTFLSFVLFASGKKYYNRKNIIFIVINSLICIIGWAISMFFNFVKVHESISIGYLFFSTAYIYIFVVLLILFIIFLF